MCTSKKYTSRPGHTIATWNGLRVYPEREGYRRTMRTMKRVRGLLPTYKLYALNEIYGWRFERDHCPSSLTSLLLYFTPPLGRLCPFVNRPSSFGSSASSFVPRGPHEKDGRTRRRASRREQEEDRAEFVAKKPRNADRRKGIRFQSDNRSPGSSRALGRLAREKDVMRDSMTNDRTSDWFMVPAIFSEQG